MWKKRLLGVLLIIVGIVSFSLSISCYRLSNGDYMSYEYYGGDAYTGIQHAAARTANNMQYLIDALKTCFGHVLMVAALILWATGLYGLLQRDEQAPNGGPTAIEPSGEGSSPVMSSEGEALTTCEDSESASPNAEEIEATTDGDTDSVPDEPQQESEAKETDRVEEEGPVDLTGDEA